MASVLGIFLGTVMGMSKTLCAMLLPLVTTIRQIPMIAWFPLIILWCGIGELSKVVVIVIAAFFPVLVNTLNGIQSTPDSYIEVADLYKLTKEKLDSISELIEDSINRNKELKILVQGSARSGKTIIALSLLHYYKEFKFL